MMIVVSPGRRGGASRKNKRANNNLTSATNSSTSTTTNSTTTTSTEVIHAVDGSMTTGLNMCFLIFSNIVLAPREAIVKALHNNPRAWKDCSRWRYVFTLLQINRRVDNTTGETCKLRLHHD
jgi:hypothetical protein